MDLVPRVFIVDDDAAMLDSLSLLIKTAGLTTEVFSTAEAFLEAYNPQHPGCLILDLRMPGMSGLELHDELLRRELLLPVIYLTGFADIPTTVRAIQAGAMDLLTKPVKSMDLLERVQAAIVQDVRRRERLRTDAVAGHAEAHNIQNLLNKLSPRELEIGKLLSQGYSNKNIARDLNISPRTVETHRARLLDKTGAHNLIELSRLFGD